MINNKFIDGEFSLTGSGLHGIQINLLYRQYEKRLRRILFVLKAENSELAKSPMCTGNIPAW